MKHLRVILSVLLPVAFIVTSSNVWAKPPRYRAILLETKTPAAESSCLMFPLTYIK